MNSDQTEYELFISYARLDNRLIPEAYPYGWVTAIKEQILADHRQYSTTPLNIFFDVHEIRDMDDWRNRILGALRRSKVLLICLSPNYFKSLPCRWEWDEYQARQHQKLIGSDSHATIYFLEVPGSSEHDNAKRLEAIMGKNFTDLRPWFPNGAAALRDEAVRQRMAVLGQTIWERLERARRALSVPGNMRSMTPYFVGRNKELADLHRQVGVGKIGLVTAVHGLGGQGKTELAVAYARGYADWYSLGIWSLAAEGKKQLLPLLGELALLPEFGYGASDAERTDAERLGRAVLMELQRRAQATRQVEPNKAPAALVLLDNVSEADLFSAAGLSKLPKVDWLRLVATTRLDPKLMDPPGKKIGHVEVSSLDPDNALRLIMDHLPDERFACPQDEADSRQLVKELGGFTLAVEQVAVFLGLSAQTSAPISPGQYLARLRADGLASTDSLVDSSVAGQMEHQEKQLGPVLRSMLKKLPETGHTALQFAALLPPDAIPWPWLRELTLAQHPDLGNVPPGHVDPWVVLRRQLEGFRFLTPGDREQTARMHRLVAAHIRSDESDVLAERVRVHLANRCYAIEQGQHPPAEWELDALLAAVPHLLAGRDHHYLAQQGTFLTEKVISYRSLSTAKAILQATHPVLQRLAAADPGNAGWQRDLSVSHNKIGDVLSTQGDLNAALRAYRASLEIAERLAAADPGNAGWQRDLSVSQEKIGDVLSTQGDLNAALRAYRASLEIAERLAAADPGNAGWQRDLSVSHNKIGDVLRTQGDLNAALRAYRASLEIAERLAAADPGNAGWQRDLSVSQEKIGDVLSTQGDLNAALRAYRASLEIRERLAAADPGNAGWQRDLSVSHNKIGDVLSTQGDLNAALRAYRASLEIRERLAAADPGNAGWQRDLSVSHNKIGDVLRTQGDLNAALRAYRASLEIRERLAAADPGNAGWQRDLSVSHDRIGDVLSTQGDLNAALRAYRASLEIAERLAAADPGNAGWQRDLSVSHNKIGDVLSTQGDLNAALRAYRASLEIRERLAAADPGNAGWQRDVWISCWRMAKVAEQQQDGQARPWWQRAYDTLEKMEKAGIYISDQDRQFMAQINAKLGAAQL